MIILDLTILDQVQEVVSAIRESDSAENWYQVEISPILPSPPCRFWVFRGACKQYKKYSDKTIKSVLQE